MNMRRSPAQLVLEIVDDRPRRTYRDRHVAAAETVKRLDAELLTKQVRSVIEFESYNCRTAEARGICE